MPWDNGVNKMAHIHAVVTTLGVRNMPLTTRVLTIVQCIKVFFSPSSKQFFSIAEINSSPTTISSFLHGCP